MIRSTEYIFGSILGGQFMETPTWGPKDTMGVSQNRTGRRLKLRIYRASE